MLLPMVASMSVSTTGNDGVKSNDTMSHAELRTQMGFI